MPLMVGSLQRMKSGNPEEDLRPGSLVNRKAYRTLSCARDLMQGPLLGITPEVGSAVLEALGTEITTLVSQKRVLEVHRDQSSAAEPPLPMQGSPLPGPGSQVKAGRG